MGNPKAFLNINRKEAGYRPIFDRIRDYSEVEQTLNQEDRRTQASRCMECGVPFCHWACPLGNKQPEWQDRLWRDDVKGAYELLSATDDFPEFTGRVCPALCEKSCVLNKQHQPVTIRENEAAIIERAFRENIVKLRPPKKRTGKRVAVIGSGPSGLAAANRLNKAGHTVVVFEKDEALGGLLRFGIPDFKLNKKIIDRRISLMREEGVEFRCSTTVGVDVTADDLKRNFDAICIATGADSPRDLSVSGRDLDGIYFALELLQQQNRINAGCEIPKDIRVSAKGRKVLVIGGGDTGSDCVGTSNRQGALSVTQIEIMPKPPVGENPDTPWPMWPQILKTSTSHEEGCERRWLLDTCCFIGDENGRVKAVEVEHVDWKRDDATGKMVLLHSGKKELIEADMVLLAMGFTGPRRVPLFDQLGLEYDGRGCIKADSDSRATNVEGVFAAGDASTGASLVVRCIASGQAAARGIDAYLAVRH